jgi:hypothetical protein
MSTQNLAGVKAHGLRVRLVSSSPFVSRLSRKCGLLDDSQLYDHPMLAAGTDLLYFILFSLFPFVEKNKDIRGVSSL